ncbi:toxin-antitoxin system, antitoxin component, Xre family protein [Fusobacterium gastrosuis]|uniref:toxin-antitoxin system, antitoxin component, Xre family protein n=1 Tax=Fusobacterium gastrosuis TaxID=1755100 RepID=UPI0029794FAE|nr:toxin-antitoxin system, antitoxin component, Xre family protein [Fusobacteriaceae bacterium]MDY5713862.1 toxin-antitoxin system, antitoxin component, Xre family protein [Fusobacterium gastrosuis]
MINTELLRQKIDESGYRFSWIAKQLNLSPYGLRKKVDGDTEFKVSEVSKICKLLNISDKEREIIFFCKK